MMGNDVVWCGGGGVLGMAGMLSNAAFLFLHPGGDEFSAVLSPTQKKKPRKEPKDLLEISGSTESCQMPLERPSPKQQRAANAAGIIGTSTEDSIRKKLDAARSPLILHLWAD